MSPIIVLLLAALIFLLGFLIKKIPFLLKLRSIPTAPGCHPFFGHLLTLYWFQRKYECDTGAAFHQWNLHVLSDNYYHDLGIYKLWLGPIPVVILTSPETTQAILQKPSHAVPKSFIYRIFDIGLKGLVNNNGLKWKNHRKLLTPAFDSRIIENMLPIVNRSSRELISELHAACNNGVVDDLSHIISYYAFKILYESAIGFKFEESRFSHIDEAVSEVEELLTKRALSPWFMSDFLFGLSNSGKRALHLLNDVLHPFSLECYTDRLKYRRERLMDGKDTHQHNSGNNNSINVVKGKISFLDILIDENDRDPENFTEEDIFGELKTFLVAGFDTTANSLTWFLQNIGSHPEIQKRIQDELDDIFSDDPSRDCVMPDLKQMRYLEACIKESMRFTSTTPYTLRDCKEDIVIPCKNMLIPRDATVLIYHYLVHKDRNHWKDALTFNPDRFFESSARDPFSYIPFSAGARNCIGQKYASLEQKALLSSILRHFTVTSLQSTESIGIEPAVTMKPKQKLSMKFTPRQARKI